MKWIVVMVLALSGLAMAQEPAEAPSLSVQDRADFAAAKAMQTAAEAASMETREWRRYLAARQVADERLQAYQRKLTTLPEYRAHLALRQKLDVSLKARGLVLDWRTGEAKVAAVATRK